MDARKDNPVCLCGGGVSQWLMHEAEQVVYKTNHQEA
jgi:hypothetical protein